MTLLDARTVLETLTAPVYAVRTLRRKFRVGWLADPGQVGGIIGGAELSAQALAAAAPEWAEVIPMNPWGVRPGCDVYVVQNCTTYSADVIPVLARAPVVKCVRDYWPDGDPALRDWLLANSAVLVFDSPPHWDAFPFAVGAAAVVVPPPVDLLRFYLAAGKQSGPRQGVIWLGQMFPHKGVDRAVAWAREHRTVVDFYGAGPSCPGNEQFVRVMGQIAPSQVPATLARYRSFLFMPRWVEPFGKAVIEAWAAGCELILDGEIGATWFLENDTHAVREAAQRFWQVVEGALLGRATWEEGAWPELD